MKKINILYIAAWGDLTGGGPVSLLHLIRNLDRDTFLPIVICPSYGSLCDALQALKVKVIVMKTRPLKKLHLFSCLRSINEVLKLMKEEQIELVHSNVGASRESFFSGLAAKIANVPFVYHARVIESAGPIDRLLAWLSTRIIVISEAVRNKYHWLRDSEKIIKIHNGVDLEEFQPETKGDEIRKEFGIAPGAALIGVIGNLIPWKGHEYFLAAAKEIKQQRKAKFIIVGGELSATAHYRKELEERAERIGIAGDIIFTGFRDDIPRIMAGLDILVLPSLGEPFGRVLIEAMACGKPVVATRDGGVPEIVEDKKTGLLVPAKNVQAMADAIMRLIDDKQGAREMGFQGRKRAEDFFDITINVRKTEDLYNSLLRAAVT